MGKVFISLGQSGNLVSQMLDIPFKNIKQMEIWSLYRLRSLCPYKVYLVSESELEPRRPDPRIIVFSVSITILFFVFVYSYQIFFLSLNINTFLLAQSIVFPPSPENGQVGETVITRPKIHSWSFPTLVTHLSGLLIGVSIIGERWSLYPLLFVRHQQCPKHRRGTE